MKKLFAVFCPVKNEKTFSSTWLKYYSKYLPKEDLYFLDFGSTGISTDCNVVPCNKNILDTYELLQSIKSFHAKLLHDYQYVIPTDVDEIIYHKSGLDNYIANLRDDYVKCTGFELIHIPEKEADFDNQKPILSQRKFWYKNSVYNKTLITNRTLKWAVGLHLCYEDKVEINPDLILLHLHRFDYKTCLERHLKFSKLSWPDYAIKKKHNWHYRIPDEKNIHEWYYSTATEITEIPEEIRNSVGI